MKFTNSALAAALAVGSAVAVPMNAARNYHDEPPFYNLPTEAPVTVTKYLPLPAYTPGVYPPGGASSWGTGTGYSKPSVSNFPVHPPPVSSSSVSFPTQFPTVSISSSAEVSSASAPASVSPTYAPGVPGVHGVPAVPVAPGAPGQYPGPQKNIIVVIKDINIEVIHIEELIEIDISNIGNQLIHIHNIDTKILLAAIVSLKLHLKHILTNIVPVLEHAKQHPGSLTEAELKIVLALVHKIQTIVIKVEHILKKVVYSVKTDVLMVIGAELHAVIRLILPITSRIVKVVLALVVYVDVSLSHLVGKITYVVNHIVSVASGITGLLVDPILVPIFQHIRDGGEY